MKKSQSQSQSQSMAEGSKQSGSASSECTTSYKQTIIYTTFLETESHCFKELVQKHTGASDGEKLPVTMPARKPSRGSSVAGLKSDFALINGGIEMGSQKSDNNGFALINSGIEVGPQKSDCNGFAFIKSGIELGSQKSDDNGFALIKSGIEVGHQKSDGNGFALIKGGIEMGPQKTAFKLQHRRQFHKRLEMNLGLSHDASAPKSAAGNGCALSATLDHSPSTPLGPVDPFTCSSTSYCYNTYSPSCSSTPSCNQSSYLEKQAEEFCFEASAIRVKSEPELLPLFPLHSPTKPRT